MWRERGKDPQQPAKAKQKNPFSRNQAETGGISKKAKLLGREDSGGLGRAKKEMEGQKALARAA